MLHIEYHDVLLVNSNELCMEEGSELKCKRKSASTGKIHPFILGTYPNLVSYFYKPNNKHLSRHFSYLQVRYILDMSKIPDSESSKQEHVRIIPIKLEEDLEESDERSRNVTVRTRKTRSSQQKLAPVKVEKEEPVCDNQEIQVVTDDSDNGQPNLCSNVNKLSILARKEDSGSGSLFNDSNEELSTSLHDEEEFEIPERSLPSYNLPEKIVIVIDTAQDEVSTDFQLSNGNSCTPLSMLKCAIEIFLHNKHSIDDNHEYALVILNENTASWILDFTNNIQDILKSLRNLEDCHTEDIFDLNSLFDVINKNIAIPCTKASLVVPPQYVVRAIMLYGRSFTVPQLTRTNEIDNILSSPYFTFDVLMTHEPPSADNNCNKIFKVFQNLDTKGFAYFFTVSRNVIALHTAMAKLLSHPLQRPVQKQANYTVT